MTKSLFFFFLFVLNISLKAQNIEVVAGPVYGHYTDSTSNFWMLVKPDLNTSLNGGWTSKFNVDLQQFFIQKTGFSINRINYTKIVEDIFVMVKGVLDVKKPKAKTKDICFLFGSCVFPYPILWLTGKKKELIFNSMAKHEKDFMIWLGDNVYYLLGEWKSAEKMHKKNLKTRLKPKLNSFMKSCPQYAMWDDHDFGSNNDDGSNVSKYESLDIFKQYWVNPYYGLDTVEGTFTHFSHSDADFFMLDTRFYANESGLLGEAQFECLKARLLESKANFKFILSGMQILTDNPSEEDMGDFGTTKEDLLEFLKLNKISGVILISGDRHYGELVKLERKGTYPLFEITSSPLTAIVNPNYTRKNILRVENTLIRKQNFGKIHLLGEDVNRKCRLELYDRDGKSFWQYDVFLSELQ